MVRRRAILVLGVMATAALVTESTSAADGFKKKGEVSVAGAAFTDDSGDEACRVAKAAYAFYPNADANGADCDLVAGIQLPDGAEVRSVSCTLYDNAPNAIQVHLVRVDLATGDPESVFVSAGTVDVGLQQVGDGTAEAGTAVVDNADYAYYLAAAFSQSDFGGELRVYGCTVAYD